MGLLVLALHFLKISPSVLFSATILVTALGTGIGLALTAVLQGFVSGRLLAAERLFHVGEILTADGKTGIVEDETLRVTILRDLTNKRLRHVIPNTKLISDSFSVEEPVTTAVNSKRLLSIDQVKTIMRRIKINGPE